MLKEEPQNKHTQQQQELKYHSLKIRQSTYIIV